MSKHVLRQLEHLFTKSRRSKIPLPKPRSKVSTPILLPRPRKLISLPRIKSNAVKEKMIIKNFRNLFRLKTEIKAVKHKIIRDIKTLFGSDKDDFYKPVWINNAFGNNYIEHDSNGDRIKGYQSKNIYKKL